MPATDAAPAVHREAVPGGIAGRALQHGAAIALVLFLAVFGLAQPSFFSLGNIANIFVQSSVLAILAIGMTFVIVAAEIDLSVGAVLALCGVLFGLMVKADFSPLVAAVAAVAVGTTLGAVSGACVSIVKIPSFVVTLGMMSVARGLALLVSDGRSISGYPEVFLQLARGNALALPIPFVVSLAFLVLGYLILEHTPSGRESVALGSNRKAAWLAGVPVGRRLVLVFGVSGTAAGLASLVLTARLDSAQPIAGMGYELDAIAAAVIGGCSLLGGRGGVVGAVVGAVLITTLRNGLNILNVSAYAQPVAIGLLIVAAAGLDSVGRRRLFRSAAE